VQGDEKVPLMITLVETRTCPGQGGGGAVVENKGGAPLRVSAPQTKYVIRCCLFVELVASSLLLDRLCPVFFYPSGWRNGKAKHNAWSSLPPGICVP
jgi:hypothetical protein